MKPRLLFLMLAILLLVTSMFVVNPLSQGRVMAQSGIVLTNATCSGVTAVAFNEFNGETSYSFTESVDSAIFATIPDFPPAPNRESAELSWPTVPNGTVITISFWEDDTQEPMFVTSYTCGSSELCNGIENDGRENPICYSPWETAAVYCTDDGGVEIYRIRPDGVLGDLVLRASQDQMDNAGDPPAHNTLIAQGGGIKLYRLSSGEWQINAPTKEPGKLYTFIWDGCGE